jgi:hypothetical protein
VAEGLGSEALNGRQARSAMAPDAAQFLRLIAMNPTLREVIDRVHRLELPDTWVAGGCLFQTVWNILALEDPARGIEDYDVFYFEPGDCSPAAEQDVNHRAARMFADLGCRIDARNQARVHLWYAQEFGVTGYPRLRKTTDGIDHFLAVCCMVGARKTADATVELYAPLGVDDVLSCTMRPNPLFPRAPRSSYEQKARRWQALWPALVVEPFRDANRPI